MKPHAKVPLLPPLPIETVVEIENLELFASGVLDRCGRWPSFNTEKASRALRACALQVFAKHCNYYLRLPGFCPAWQREIIERVIAGLGGLIGIRAENPEKETISLAMRETIEAFVSGNLQLSPTKAAAGSVKESVENAPDNRALIDNFLLKMADSGRPTKRNEIWFAAGYADATEFERFQRGAKPPNQKAARTFRRILAMSPDEFMELLDEHKKQNSR
jgi:hypothetical protein